MMYEDIDEAAKYQEACRKVKQIAEAIKNMRIKYYPNFVRISEEDKQVYNELNLQIEKIARENGLNQLKDELINEITDKYDGQVPLIDDQEQGQRGNIGLYEKVLKVYYGAIDVEKYALSKGKIKQALKCQAKANACMTELQKSEQEEDRKQLVEMATHYKREKFAELAQTKEQITNWKVFLEDCWQQGNIQEKDGILQEIADKGKDTGEKDKMNINEFVME